MNPSYHDPDSRHVDALFEALFEGTLTPPQARELDALLVRDPTVRRRYVEHVQLHSSLATGVGDRSGPLDAPPPGLHSSNCAGRVTGAGSPRLTATSPVMPPAATAVLPPVVNGVSHADISVDSPLMSGVTNPPPLAGGSFFHNLPLVLFSLMVFVGGAALGVYFRHGSLLATIAAPAVDAPHGDIAPTVAESAKTSGKEIAHVSADSANEDDVSQPRPTPFATLVKVNGCKWGASTLPTQTGSRLSAGLLRLDSGKAQITFDNGARLYLQGPAVFYLYGPSRTHLQSGKLVANVPEQAIGFTIETQKAEIVDLGTEFGVDVAATGETEVQVLDGEVEVGAAPAPADPQARLQQPESAFADPVSAARQRLLEGEARRISAPPAEWQRVEYTPDLFRQLRPKVRRTPESPWRPVLSDDFDDNFLDTEKWRVSTDSVPGGTPQIREVDGRIVLVDRGRLVTVNQLDPVRLEGLRITGQWTFKTPEDIFDVVVRTDGVPMSDGSIQEGIHFRAWMERTTSHIGIFGTGRVADLAPAFGDILINPGDVFNFEILDVPGGMSLRLWEASGSGAEAHVHTHNARPAEANYVVFHNRHRGKSVRVAYLDNLVIEQGNGNVRMTPEGLIEVKKQD